MRNVTLVLGLFMIVPAILIVLEIYFCKNQMRAALIMPVVVACCFIIFGIYAFMLAAVLFIIYYVFNHLQKVKESKSKEIDKMSIEDL